jgi:hypothetical protein
VLDRLNALCASAIPFAVGFVASTGRVGVYWALTDPDDGPLAGDRADTPHQAIAALCAAAAEHHPETEFARRYRKGEV